ncbi:CCA tRNA nucleotidyltransferase [Deinococcus aerophilus]|uniref:tRNA nucleotidyltransferase n=1 Tax=Deinococcus aerophilus TaxID=522488 RepID=A0ABQ2GYW3_9DEIO|nr:CCA tRNA nucleotidyltransferase [Deinococcus aerophilus]GGM17690.1 tRNA nucleotidyltransferase [Deinococcus aerophilus]
MTPDPATHAWAQLQDHDRTWLTGLARQAGPQARLALVGGAVRDALLGHTPLDLDVVVEGAGVEALARASGLPTVFHPAFHNATVTLPDGRTADLVRARRESYPVPGENPRPHPGTLEEDLRRRDFTVNALALLIGPQGPVCLLDEVGGQDDLKARTLRPLHPASLREDASRLVRAARLAARLGLTASPELLRQVPDALELADRTPRLWAELRLLFSEPRPGAAARVLAGWGAGTLLPGLETLEALDRLQRADHPLAPALYAAAALHAAPDPTALAGRLSLGDRPGALLARALSDTYFPEDTPERLLRGVLRPDAAVPLTGRDVLALGVLPGRAVGEALAHLAGLRRAGRVGSPEEERAALRAYLKASHQPDGARGGP